MPEQTEQVDEHVRASAHECVRCLKEMVTSTVDRRSDRTKQIVRLIGGNRSPSGRGRSSPSSIIGAPLAGVGLAFVVVTLGAGVVLAITFFGLAIMALSVRIARGFGGFQRQLARGLLDEQIEDPEPFVARPGFLGWLQSALRDRTGWRSMAYLAIKVPLAAREHPRRVRRMVGRLLLHHLPDMGWPGQPRRRLRAAARSSSERASSRLARAASSTVWVSSAPASCSSLRRRGPCASWSISTAASCGSCSPPMP